MKRIFDLNNPVWQFVGKLFDAFILHIIWLVCCIPIVTFGPATTALYYAMMRDVRDEDAHYVRAFFRSFKENLKQGIILGLIFLVVGVLLGYGLWFYTANRSVGTLYNVLWAIDIGMLIIYAMTLQYVFALQSRFVNTVRTTISNAFFMSIRHIGWTFVMLVLFAGVYFIVLWFNFIPLLLLGYGLIVYLDSYILNHIFKPYVKQAEELTNGGEEKDPDAWTLPEIEDEEKEMQFEEGKIRTRFAPSPTGRMHVGNLRTALYAYLIAKHENGDFLLRIEDTDQERYVEGAVDIINRTLEKTGLKHDEGPDKDGGCGPYVQSERQKAGIYMKYAKKLIDKGEAYY